MCAKSRLKRVEGFKEVAVGCLGIVNLQEYGRYGGDGRVCPVGDLGHNLGIVRTASLERI